ncbi:hypothetical protein [Psychroserpens sp. MEBiC05023]
MKNLCLISVVLVSFFLNAQEDIEVCDHKTCNWGLSSFYNLEVNRFIPIGSFSKTLEQSVGAGFYFGIPLDDKLRLDLGTSVFFPKTKSQIRYYANEEVLEGNANLSGTLGVWLTKVKRIGKNWYWDNRFGTGLGFFQTDIKTGKPKEDNDSVYGVETVFVNLGTAIRTQLFKSNIGIKFDYFFVPYNLFKKRLPSNFGEQYLTVGLIYGL